MLSTLNKLTPAAPKAWLIALAGLLWFGVGLMLDGFALRWFRLSELSVAALFALMGLLLAAAIYRFGFSKLAEKNIRRIRGLAGEKACLFAFQAWSSYPLVAVMISMGIYLRVYSPIPKPLLASGYLGIGTALFSASLHYFAHLFQQRQARLEA
ncbi:MAG: hypothetical protein RBS68_13360 [Anaerolineales bacterium]|nr:hypothetical protein [Anaerolineales bacterium]